MGPQLPRIVWTESCPSKRCLPSQLCNPRSGDSWPSGACKFLSPYTEHEGPYLGCLFEACTTRAGGGSFFRQPTYLPSIQFLQTSWLFSKVSENSNFAVLDWKYTHYKLLHVITSDCPRFRRNNSNSANFQQQLQLLFLIKNKIRFGKIVSDF